MDNYVKSVIFILILALAAWNITCQIPPQGQPIYTHKAAGSASLSLIQQESNLQPIQPGSTALHPTTQIPSISTNPSTGLPTVQPNRGNTRDFVNLPQNSRGPQTNIRNTASQSSSTTNRDTAPVRDYVNPQAPLPGRITPQNTPSMTQTGQQSQTTNKGNVRDYVNPSSGVLPKTIPNLVINTRTPTTTRTNSPPSRGAVRDYVNPSIGVNTNVRPVSGNQQGSTTQISYANAGSTSATNSPKQITNVRDYVAPQRPGQPIPTTKKPDFPPLPKAGTISSTNNGGMSTPLSYAQKVSSGITTKSPLNIPKPSLPGPTGSSTTPKPDEGPTDVELRDFSEAILRRDVNNAAKYVTANIQGKTNSQSQTDEAPQKLLDIDAAAYQIPTIAKLKLLHNNYILNTDENEHITAQERAEENDLLDAMLSTPIMQYTRNFLISKEKLSRDPKDFKDLLKTLWFNMYSRGSGKISSSGFEHIFLAELKKNEVSGLHNWIYFNQAEMTNLADYFGYMKKIDLGEKGSILKFRFKLNGVDKPVDSMFIGTSPELEMALYTTCYLFRANRVCPLKLNGNKFIVRTYNIKYRGKNMIGSAFPEI